MSTENENLAEKIVVDNFKNTDAFIHIQDAKQFCKKSVLEALQYKDEQWRKAFHALVGAWQAGKSFNEFVEFLHKNFGNEKPATN